MKKKFLIIVGFLAILFIVFLGSWIGGYQVGQNFQRQEFETKLAELDKIYLLVPKTTWQELTQTTTQVQPQYKQSLMNNILDLQQYNLNEEMLRYYRSQNVPKFIGK